MWDEYEEKARRIAGKGYCLVSIAAFVYVLWRGSWSVRIAAAISVVSFFVYSVLDPEEDDDEKPKRKDEVIAEFKDGKKEVETDSIATDEMEPSVYTTEGAKVKIEGTFMNDDFDDEEEDEDDDDAYQGSDSE